MFADTPAGADASAAIYSIIETAKANNVDPYAYLKDIFTTLPNVSNSDEIEVLLPWNWRKVQAH